MHRCCQTLDRVLGGGPGLDAEKKTEQNQKETVCFRLGSLLWLVLHLEEFLRMYPNSKFLFTECQDDKGPLNLKQSLQK